MRWIYSVLLAIVAPLLWLWMFLRARRAGGQWGILSAARFGRYVLPWDGAKPVWVHAVSLGETRAAAPLIRMLLRRGNRILLTHMTATGRAEGARLFADDIATGQLHQQWLPYDFERAVSGFFDHYRPRLGVLVEREVWPNLIAHAKLRHIPMLMVNARFSQAARGHVRQIDRVFRSLMRDAYASLDLVLAQTAEDAARLFEVGVKNLHVVGNIKFDLQLPALAVDAGRAWQGALARPVIAIASTREGEDQVFIRVLKRLLTEHTRPLFLLIPRHPQRFDEAETQLADAGLRYAKWSDIRQADPKSSGFESLQVILGNTVGEMPFFYAASHVAIVAGSFAAFGGHNLIEPCAVGTPVVVGPHTNNFKEAVQDAVAQGVAVQIKLRESSEAAKDSQSGSGPGPGPNIDAEDRSALLAVVQALDWLSDPVALEQRGQRARQWVALHAGATARTVEKINEFENALAQ